MEDSLGRVQQRWKVCASRLVARANREDSAAGAPSRTRQPSQHLFPNVFHQRQGNGCVSEDLKWRRISVELYADDQASSKRRKNVIISDILRQASHERGYHQQQQLTLWSARGSRRATTPGIRSTSRRCLERYTPHVDDASKHMRRQCNWSQRTLPKV